MQNDQSLIKQDELLSDVDLCLQNNSLLSRKDNCLTYMYGSKCLNLIVKICFIYTRYLLSGTVPFSVTVSIVIYPSVPSCSPRVLVMPLTN